MYDIIMEPTIGKRYWVHDISLDHAKLSKNERIFTIPANEAGNH